MMDAVVYTDILSTFAKLEKLRLLTRLFPKSRILICPSVYKEVKRGESKGMVRFSMTTGFDRIKLELPEKRFVRGIRESRNLSLGDAECISVARNRKCLLLTNDAHSQKLADTLSIPHLSLPSLLRGMWTNNITSKNRLDELIKEIERRDRIVIKNKALIFA